MDGDGDGDGDDDVDVDGDGDGEVRDDRRSRPVVCYTVCCKRPRAQFRGANIVAGYTKYRRTDKFSVVQ